VISTSAKVWILAIVVCVFVLTAHARMLYQATNSHPECAVTKVDKDRGTGLPRPKSQDTDQSLSYRAAKYSC